MDGSGKANTEMAINFINGEPATSPGAAAMAVFTGGKYQVRPRPRQPPGQGAARRAQQPGPAAPAGPWRASGCCLRCSPGSSRRALQVGATLQQGDLRATLGADFTTHGKGNVWSIDWQPSYIRLYVNGIPLQEFVPDGGFKVCLVPRRWQPATHPRAAGPLAQAARGAVAGRGAVAAGGASAGCC